MTAIEAKNLCKSYAGGRVRALSNVDLRIESGQVVGLLGPNGAGKTTFMKLLTGYLKPDEGSVTVHGIDVAKTPQAAQALIGYLPENAPLYQEMVVQEYLQMMAGLRGIPLDQQRKSISRAVRATGLTDRLTDKISALSKGYRQRVGIAQAIIHKPRLLILDEPTTGLDPSQISEIRQLIRGLAKESTVLLSTHILAEVERSCDRVVMIASGRLRADAPISELRGSAGVLVGLYKLDSDKLDESRAALAGIDGVDDVELREQDGDEHVFLLRMKRHENIGAAPPSVGVFRALQNSNLPVSRIAGEQESLESIFNSLTQRSDASEEAVS